MLDRTRRETLDHGYFLPTPRARPDRGWLIGWVVASGSIGLAIALTQYFGG